MAVTRVRLFGLTIESELPLPGLLAAADGIPPDVHVRLGTVGQRADLDVEGVARFAVRGGREIIVDALSAAPQRNVRLFLLGSAMGLLLHQRGLFPLHANAVEAEGRAIAVAGPSGAGKSTLAAWFHDHGQRLIADDICVLAPQDGAFIAYPGMPRLRLWGEAIEASGRNRTGLERAYADDALWDKWDVPVTAEAVVAQGMPLAAIYVLEDATDHTIAPLTGAAAAEALFAHTYRGAYVIESGQAAAHWRTVTALLAVVPVFRLGRPLDLTRRDELGRLLLGHARGQAARTGGSAR